MRRSRRCRERLTFDGYRASSIVVCRVVCGHSIARAAQCGVIVAKLEDSDNGMRKAALVMLGKLDAASLAQYTVAILSRLSDSDESVRAAALETLGKLDAASLAQHGAAIVAKLEHKELKFLDTAQVTLILHRIRGGVL